MRKYFLFLALLLSIAVFSQKSKHSSTLWEISGNGLKQPSYLFGTIHLICKEDFVLSEIVKEKFNSSSQIFMELDLDDFTTQSKMLQLTKLPKGTTLKDMFTNEQYEKLDSFCKVKKIALNTALNFKPMFLQSLMMQKSLPCATTESYEMTLVSMAMKSKKDIKGLETLEVQMAVFDSIPDSTEIAEIMDFVNNYDKSVAEFSQLVEAYKKQDIDKLYETMIASPQIGNYAEIFLFNRNRNWVKVISNAAINETCFFAFGSGHLGGENGMIELLKKAGYKLKPVSIN